MTDILTYTCYTATHKYKTALHDCNTVAHNCNLAPVYHSNKTVTHQHMPVTQKYIKNATYNLAQLQHSNPNATQKLVLQFSATVTLLQAGEIKRV